MMNSTALANGVTGAMAARCQFGDTRSQEELEGHECFVAIEEYAPFLYI